jgi:transglutaminase-like putative cysteine protease
MKPLPHPLAPELRSVGLRELAWLVAALLLVAAPHALRVPWWLVLLTVCLYAWRLYFSIERKPLPSGWLVLGVAAIAILGVWMETRTVFGRTSGIYLLVVFSGLKLLETRTQRDAAVVAFLGYFLVITNFLYTQSIPTALVMCAALLVLTIALVGLAAPQRATRANVRSAALLLGHAAPAALVLFLLFPRVQGPLWGLPQDAYAAMSGLSDTMAPGNISRLVLSDAVAFRAEFRGESPAFRQLYWRGPVLWEFDGRAWSAGPQFLARFVLPERGSARFDYDVVLEPHNRTWLFALESAASMPERTRITPDGQLVTAFPVRARIRYAVTSFTDAELPAEEATSALRRALRLPPAVNPRATALAQEWREQSRSDAEVLERAVQFLRAGKFQYTLEPPPLGEDGVDDFLFRTKSGFCEHFASSFTFLMRAAGVPARVVMGYQGGEQNPVDSIVTVRQLDAHAWSEVFLRGRGWVRVDPTVAAAPRRLDTGLARSVADAAALPFLSRTEFPLLRGLRHQWEALAHKWNVWVLGYNPERQRELMSLIGMPDADWRSLTATLFTVLGLMTVALIAWSLRRLTRPDPVQKAWLAFCRKLGERGLARAPHEGPRDYSERAARALPASRQAILRIAALYVALRYGRQAGTQAAKESVARLRQMVRELQLT